MSYFVYFTPKIAQKCKKFRGGTDFENRLAGGLHNPPPTGEDLPRPKNPHLVLRLQKAPLERGIFNEFLAH